MKNTKKITLCGIISALAVVVMLAGYFPYLTYAIPAVAGLFMIVPLIECGAVWALGCYAATSIIALLIGESETKILFVILLGYYPILKAVIERLKSRIAEWILKLILFNVAAIASYFIMSLLFDISFSEFALWGKYGAYIFLALCNVVFVIYDIGISRVGAYYSFALHDKIKKIIK
ncbi:MAG: hypothetical protein Q4B40_05030 [Clostridia bacterium]|nr:hypothetical protein [Clostridia bacterium]